MGAKIQIFKKQMKMPPKGRSQKGVFFYNYYYKNSKRAKNIFLKKNIYIQCTSLQHKKLLTFVFKKNPYIKSW